MPALQSSLGNTTQVALTHSELQPPKIKILFFTSSLGNGGAEMHLLRMVNALDRGQFQLSIALARTGGTYEANLVKDIPIYGLNPPGMPSSLLRMLRAIAPLRQRIQTEQPDIVCAVQDHANLAALWACQGLSSRPKVVICVQNAPLALYRRFWHPRDQAMRLLMQRFYPQADRIVALSKGVAKDLQTLVNSDSLPLEVIYNAGMDAAVESSAKEPLSLEDGSQRPQPLIVACGRLHQQKGFPYLLQAIAQVRQTVPVQLWIVGEGPLRPVLERQIRHLGLTDAVQLLGFQSNPYKYMAAADIFVLSSLYEGFGNVVVEAMACGVPVIATDCTHGPAEILDQGRYGLLVPPADSTALAEKILALLHDPPLRQQLAQRGRERSRHFHAQAIAQDYADLFSRILDNGPAHLGATRGGGGSTPSQGA